MMKADGRIKLQHEIIAGGFVSEEQSVIVYSIRVLNSPSVQLYRYMFPYCRTAEHSNHLLIDV